MNIMRRQCLRLSRPAWANQVCCRFSAKVINEETAKDAAKDFSSLSAEQQKALKHRLEELEANKPDLQNIYQYNLESLSELPNFLQFMEPLVSGGKDFLLEVLEATDMPLWVLTALICVTVRTALIPLVFVQMRKLTSFITILPVIKSSYEVIKSSKSKTSDKWKARVLSALLLMKVNKVNPFGLVLFNLVHIPFLFTNIFIFRRLLSDPAASSSSFFWLENYLTADPYCIFPTLSVAIYYYNFGRNITPHNRHLLINRAKAVGQVLVILWYPLLINWPAGVTFYIFCNAVYSLFQSRLLSSMWFIRKVNPKMIITQLILQSAEYDKQTSDMMIDSLKNAEESFINQNVDEEEIEKSTVETMEKILEEKDLEAARLKYRNFFGL